MVEIEGLLKPLYELDEYRDIIDYLKKNSAPAMIAGIFESQKAHIASGIIKELDKPSIFIASNELIAKKIYEDLKFFLGGNVLFYPVKQPILYNVEAEGSAITESRLSVIENIIRKDNYTIVLSVEALQTKLPPIEIFKSSIKRLRVGEKYDIESISELLTNSGYSRVDMVEGKGQYSIRGGILDFFPVNRDNAYRVDFFGDEIDTIKILDALTQRSFDSQNEVLIFPAREIIFDRIKAEQAVLKIKKDLETIKMTSRGKNLEHFSKLQRRVEQDIEKISNGIHFTGIEKYISYFYEKTFSLIEYLPQGSLIFFDEMSRIAQTAGLHLAGFNEMIKDSIEKGNILPQSSVLLLQFGEIVNSVKKHNIVHLNTFIQEASELKPVRFANIASKPTPAFNGRMDLLINDIKGWRDKKNRIVVLAGSSTKAEKMIEILDENGISASVKENIQNPPKPKEVIITHGSVSKGFEYSSIKLIIISDKEILGEEKRRRKHKRKVGEKIKSFTDLSEGDFVVHQIHGIGQYIGINQLKVEGIVKDYFKIKYVQGDLFVPVSQLNLIQKYIGSEGKSPKINKLGGADWHKTKTKVKESVQELAKGLIRLQAERETSKGYSYPKDTVWQRQFEETFPYEETDDQLQCIEEVKSDMEKERSMDRLLCGDVGYGKTEVAMRAAFKAVMGGKQIAYLVPTTILAQQHYTNFVQRMRDFPVKIEMLSRFRTPKEQKNIVKALKDGLIDIVIGTHRLLQKDISFKELGFLIIDEEQRFGVSHKETIKLLKKNVDVLTLTATPIPRTLHMAMVGVRNMSVIEEPPEERYPIQTYVLEYDSELVKDAIIKELNRGGQVFYLYNKVASIHKIASFVQKLVPEARVAFAHGQMSESELENIIFDFIDGEFDVLVCTTIIETGVDMPNVNTIIVEDADKMGLAQLYQLRGRVGRSNRQAFAYLTFRKDKVLSEEAEKRLKAIKEFTEFGSGFKIAMRDLEIRGAGNLLGPEQHGHMNLVGYDTYCRILEDTIKELKGEVVNEMVETTIDINISAYIDDRYIGNSAQKIEMYKKIAAIENEEDVMEIRTELTDRFGNIPQETSSLIEIAYIKALCISAGIVSVVQKGSNILFTFAEGKADLKAVGELTNRFKKRILFTASTTPYITFKTEGFQKDKLLENIKFLLQIINKLHGN